MTTPPYIKTTTPTTIGALARDENDHPLGVVIEPPMWDPLQNAAITKKGTLCKRCQHRPTPGGCWQHKVHSGERVVLHWSVGSKLRTSDGKVAVLGMFPHYTVIDA